MAFFNSGMLSLTNHLAPREACSGRVPKLMHAVWLGTPLPGKHALHVLKFAQLNPSWAIYLWLDYVLEANEATILKAVSDKIHIMVLKDHSHRFENRGHICSNDNYAGKSDLIRLEVVFMYGGIYVDLDTIPFKGFDQYGELFQWPFVAFRE